MLVLGIESGQVLGIGDTELVIVEITAGVATVRWLHGEGLSSSHTYRVDSSSWTTLKPCLLPPVASQHQHRTSADLILSHKARNRNGRGKLCIEAPTHIDLSRDARASS